MAEQVGRSERIEDLETGFAGGFLFGIPLIYTMEAWDVGASIEPWLLAIFFIAVLAVNIVLIRISGFKDEKARRFPLAEAIEAMAIGIVGCAVVLLIIDRVNFSTSPDVWVGRVLIESIPFSLGVCISNLLLKHRGDTRLGERDDGGQTETQALLSDVGATMVGAAFVSYAISPTDEIDLLASALGPLHMMWLVVFSLVASFVIVFQSEFSNAQGRRSQPGAFQQPITETVLAYVVSLLIATFLLLAFNQIEASNHWRVTLDHVLVLGLPAAIGGAAGRLAV
ncbi:MAG: TIGR02587 family membrane protein [Dehalococcoidia bacterium]